MPKTTARHIVDFRDVTGDRHLIGVTADPQLNPIILTTKQEPDYRTVNASGASFPKTQSAQQNDFRIHYFSEDQWQKLDLKPTDENYRHVQPLGKDHWLLIRGRSRSDEDLNAHIYDSHGDVVRSFAAGDGIEDVQVTSDSKIWISYFDEGVFSNVTIGHTGLNCFDENGQKICDYFSIGNPKTSIDDCYALNVCSDRETWIYFYSDFPVVKITDRKEAKCWPEISVYGSHSFAVIEGYVVFAGSYDERDILFKVELATKKIQKLMPVLEDGTVIKSFYSFSRAHHLFLVTDNSLYVIDARCS